jgi:hypothetical protein
MAEVFSLAKWRLFLTVLPFTALFCLAKFAMHRFGWEPWAFDSLTGALFGAASFVIAFVLSGTLGDYNASGDMIVQLVNAVESIQDANLLVAAAQHDYDAGPIRRSLARVLENLLAWLREGEPLEHVDAALAGLNADFLALQQAAGQSAVNRLQGELAKMRILIRRMQINRATTFLGPAYALLEIFLVGAILALLLIGADRFSENLVISCFLFTSFTYLLLLIRDLDNPFQYDGRTSVDIDLSLVEAILAQVKAPALQRPAS